MMKKRFMIIGMFLVAFAAALLGIVSQKHKSIEGKKNQEVFKQELTNDKNSTEGNNISGSNQLQNFGYQPGKLSLENFAKKDFKGTDFKIGQVLDENSSYTRYYITYKSDGSLVSGIMNVPKGKGPFPVLILNHGYINPSVYTNGRGLKREQDYLAKEGYVVVHPDYRGHADSAPAIDNEEDVTFGYAEDVINAILALKQADFSFADTDRIGMLGHSLGGGVALQAAVVRPDLVRAIVLFAPVSSDAWDNHIRWQRETDGGNQVIQKYGTRQSNSDFWDGISPISYFDKIQVPILVHQGSADESVPPEWSEKTVDALKKAGKSAELKTYPGEPHEFTDAWPTVMKRTADFFDKNI